MLSPDVALVQLINRTATAYVQNAPAYITYRERMHISAPSLGRTQDVNRYVAVRQADDFAVMQDLPQGAQRTGQAFPVIPYFDPFTQFSFSWFANMKRIDITLNRGPVGLWPMPPADPGVNVVVPYLSFWAPSYLPDSTDSHIHVRIEPTPTYGSGFYPYDVQEDAQTGLPAHVEMRTTDDTEIVTFDYKVIDGHWVITHGSFTSMEHFGPLTFRVIADTYYEDMTFPATPPDPRLAGTPAPTPTPAS
jgi:hypothetical protein